MTIVEIKSKLQSAYDHLVDTVANLSESQCMHAPENKWSGLQHIKHIDMTLSPVVKFFGDREKYFSRNFGEADRAPRSYESIQDEYVKLLTPGIVAPDRYTPTAIPYSDKESVNQDLLIKVSSLLTHMDQWTEVELDRYLIPHPLLGDITLREILFFSIYHSEHHRKNVEKTLGG